jgi:hypothetical protein
MSKTCEQCRRRIRSEGGMTAPILRKDPATGYTCRFCSEACADAWSPTHPAPVAAALNGESPAAPPVFPDPA